MAFVSLCLSNNNKGQNFKDKLVMGGTKSLYKMARSKKKKRKAENKASGNDH